MNVIKAKIKNSIVHVDIQLMGPKKLLNTVLKWGIALSSFCHSFDYSYCLQVNNRFVWTEFYLNKFTVEQKIF